MRSKAVRFMKQKVIHCIASCSTCGWSCEDYKIARTKGREHAYKNNHKVTVETGLVMVFDGSKFSPGPEEKHG